MCQDNSASAGGRPLLVADGAVLHMLQWAPAAQQQQQQCSCVAGDSSGPQSYCAACGIEGVAPAPMPR